MPSFDQNNKIEARLLELERQVRSIKGWVIVLGLGLLVSMFGSTAWRLWQINAACNAITAENPSLTHSECMRRVNNAWANDQDTIRVD